MTKDKKGSLVIVGTGIDVAGQMTLKAKSYIENADIVFSVVSGQAVLHWLGTLNDNVVSLMGLYDEGKSRVQTYHEMIEAMVSAVYEGKKVVGAFYGHPGVFVFPTHKAIARLKAEGYDAHMDPGISAEDCLITDLGIDPGMTGMQSYEATQLLFYKHRLDPACMLILWQIGLTGEHTFRTLEPGQCEKGLRILTDMLLEHYPEDHEVIMYEAAMLPVFDPVIDRFPLKDLPKSKSTMASTLVIPSLGKPEFDIETLGKLGLTLDDVLQSMKPEFE